jgi:hypothetical protein
MSQPPLECDLIVALEEPELLSFPSSFKPFGSLPNSNCVLLAGSLFMNTDYELIGLQRQSCCYDGTACCCVHSSVTACAMKLERWC